MACIRSQISSNTPMQFPRTRRPALVPANCTLTAAEREELVRTRTCQPLFPPPDANHIEELRFPSPGSESSASDTPIPSVEKRSTGEQSPSPSLRSRGACSGLPKAISRDPRRRAAYLKARAQYARDRKLQQMLGPDEEDRQMRLRKHSAFVVSEELQSEREARADTPHLSEILPGDDEIVQELEQDVQGAEDGEETVFLGDRNVASQTGTSTASVPVSESEKSKQD